MQAGLQITTAGKKTPQGPPPSCHAGAPDESAPPARLHTALCVARVGQSSSQSLTPYTPPTPPFIPSPAPKSHSALFDTDHDPARVSTTEPRRHLLPRHRAYLICTRDVDHTPLHLPHYHAPKPRPSLPLSTHGHPHPRAPPAPEWTAHASRTAPLPPGRALWDQHPSPPPPPHGRRACPPPMRHRRITAGFQHLSSTSRTTRRPASCRLDGGFVPCQLSKSSDTV